MNLHNALAGMAFVLAAVFWFILAKRRQRGKTAAGGLNVVQVIFLLSLAAMLILAVLTWNDRSISMPLLGSLLGSVISGLPLLQPAKEDIVTLQQERMPAGIKESFVCWSYSLKSIQ